MSYTGPSRAPAPHACRSAKRFEIRTRITTYRRYCHDRRARRGPTETADPITTMNPDLHKLQPYPFEKLAALKAGATPPRDKSAITLSIGEPQHTSPAFVLEELVAHLASFANYPLSKGTLALRETLAAWLTRRFDLDARTIDPEHQDKPDNSTREALFSFAQAVIDRTRSPRVVMPNPFYQIYEGAALLAGAEPWFINTTAATRFIPDLDGMPDEVWRRCQLVYICTPGNPSGAVMDVDVLCCFFVFVDCYDFFFVSDECYSEIYPNEAQPPLGLLQVCKRLGRDDYRRCVVFHSLSKRSNLPGLRSGFVAGDATILKDYLRYRTYHGCALPPPVQAASIRAWNDEEHVRLNRAHYRAKFAAVLDILQPVLDVQPPDAGFYLWPETPIDEERFVRELFATQNVTVLPGSYLSREAHGGNPGKRRVRIALVPPLADCIEAARRMRDYVQSL